MVMATKRRTRKKEAAAIEAEAKPPVEAVEMAKPEEPAPLPPQAPPMEEKPARNGGGGIKNFAIFVLLAAAVFMAYYFMVMVPENSFVPGTEVDAETFKNLFLAAPKVYIVMDIRGAQDYSVSNNILQCGVDFAGSTGMGGKYVTPLSISRDGCVTPDGVHQPKECFSMISDGISVYVREGDGGARYYSNGMVVFVGKDYALGTCSIKRL